MRKILLFIITVITINSCSNKSNYDLPLSSSDMNFEIAEEIIPITRQAGAGTQHPNTESNYFDDKKIIKDARIGVEVKEYSIYRSNLDSLIHYVKGYISSDNLDKNDYSINCNMTIRIPAQNFEKFISILEKGSGKLKYKNISARDVTEEFIDIEARLKTKKEVEQRYRQLLSKAKNIKEILEVEEKLRVLREEIESREGRLKYLKKQVAFSTVYLQITQKLDYKYEPTKEKSFLQRLFKSLDKGWKGLIIFLLFMFRIWPLIIIGLIAVYYIRIVRKKRKQKLAKAEADQNTNRTVKQRTGNKKYYYKPKQTKTENKTKSNK